MSQSYFVFYNLPFLAFWDVGSRIVAVMATPYCLTSLNDFLDLDFFPLETLF